MKAIIKRATTAALTAAMMLTAMPAIDFSSVAAATTSVPEGFVYTNGTQFMCDGSPYNYGGTNCYYLTYKSKQAVDNVFSDCKDMGLNVIRVWGHLDAGVKTGQVNSNGYAVFQNSADGSGEKDGVYFQYFDKEKNRPVINEGEDGLQRLDYVIAQAEKNNIKLILTFTNYWQAFGGMEQYCKWVQEAGLGSNLQVDDFYTNETCKQWYKDYVKGLLNHKNVYTGEKLKDSEAVFAWELANEPRVERQDSGCKNDILYNWAKEMSAYVKSVDPYHMVSVGDEGFFNYDRQGDIMKNVVDSDYAFAGGAGVDFDKLMTIDTVDFGTPHFYCDSWNLKITGEGKNGGDDDIDWLKLHAESAQKVNKPVVLEEFGLKDKTVRDEKYKTWLDLIDGTTEDAKFEYQGFNYWMIASYMEDGTYYPDYDGYTVYGPVDVEAEKGTANARKYIVESAAKMNKKNICNVVTPDKSSFNKDTDSDLVLTANMKMGTPIGISYNGTALKKGTDYTISGNKITLKKSYLSKFKSSETPYEFKLLASEGNSPVFKVTIDDNKPQAVLTPDTAEIDRNVKKCSDVTVDITLNGNTLKSITNNGVELNKGSDYTVSGSTVTLSKSYLTTLEKGEATLTFNFEPGKSKSFNIKVNDTTGEDEFDAFESYESSDDLWKSYTRNQGGNEVSLSLADKNGSKALAFGYNIGNPNYCGVTKQLKGKNFSGYKGVSLWIEGDNSGNQITIQLKDKEGRYREGYIDLNFTGSKNVFIPFSEFKAPSWQGGNDTIDTSSITEFSIYAGGSGKTTGTVYIDNIYAADSAVVPDEDVKNINSCAVSLSSSTATYTGEAVKPTVTVKNGSEVLKNGTDYTAAYKNNVNAGTASVVITGKGKYTGTVTKTFKINRKSVSYCASKLSTTSVTFTGDAHKPTATVKIGGKTISSDNYTLSYANNIKAGTGLVKITGKNNLSGYVVKKFTINPKSLKYCKVELKSSTFSYTGKAVKPAVRVKIGDKAVYSGNYTLTYKNNVNKGTATVTITGKGNLQGSVVKKFTIK